MHLELQPEFRGGPEVASQAQRRIGCDLRVRLGFGFASVTALALAFQFQVVSQFEI